MTPATINLVGLVDDFGNLIRAYQLPFEAYLSRYYFYNGDV